MNGLIWIGKLLETDTVAGPKIAEVFGMSTGRWFHPWPDPAVSTMAANCREAGWSRNSKWPWTAVHDAWSSAFSR